MIEQDANVMMCKFGSHLYGLSTPSSDVDWKGIYLPNIENLLLGNYAKTHKASTGGAGKNAPGDIDMEVISLPRFVELACQGETFAIDMLHANTAALGEFGWVWEDLVSKRTDFYSKSLKAFVGYVKRQAAKYGVKGSRLAALEEAYECAQAFLFEGKQVKMHEIIDKLPINEHCVITLHDSGHTGPQRFYEICGRKFQDTLNIETFMSAVKKIYDAYGARAQLAKDNDGVGWKAMSHALRAGYQARDIYLHGDFEYPLRETPFLLDVKQGKLDFMKQVNPVLEELVEEVDNLCDKSTMRSKVDRVKWDAWLMDVYFESFKTLQRGSVVC